MTTPYHQAVANLDARGFGIKADLGRIGAITELLDHPELTYPTIHVAGTNGKSTTTRMIGSILASHGIKSGTYVSPHLQTVRERIALVAFSSEGPISSLISQDEFAAIFFYLLPFVQMVENERDEQVTYFEVLTAMAFEWMSDKVVGAAVVEAGLGGRWDATNVIQSAVSVLSHIDVDHRKLLGTTAADNAREKTGIIEAGSTVISAAQQDDVREVIQDACLRSDARLVLMGRDVHLVNDQPAVGGRVISVAGIYDTYSELMVPLFGSHQARNAAIAVVACEAFVGQVLDQDAVWTGLSSVRSAGRLEVVGRDPLVVLDGAHNPDGAAALAAALPEAFGARFTTMVIAIFDDKDIEGILGHLVPVADRIIFTRSDSPRAADPRRLAALVQHAQVSVIESLSEAIDTAKKSAKEGELILVTGSLLTVGEARDHLAFFSNSNTAAVGGFEKNG
ncbi:MAG: folylpolyglutamate synthase/dihydrofolate synthase family protein [Actinomycetota bacterium]